MDAYDLHQELFKAWQELAHRPDAGSIKKTWEEVPVYVDSKRITNIKIEDGKIILETT